MMFFHGIQIQLLTYMDIIAEKQQKMPAGVLYFNLIEPIINSGKNLTEEEIELKIKQEFRMKGLVLADVKVIKMMDKTLEQGSSSIIPVYLGKDETISDVKSSVITKDEFSKLRVKIRKIIEEIANEILNGNIDIRPIYDKKTKTEACKYCSYKTICAFDTNENSYKYIDNKTKKELLNSLYEEV